VPLTIIPNYSLFRCEFSVAHTIDPLDGQELWDTARVRADGFATLNISSLKVLPITATVNPSTAGATIGANDAAPGTPEYQWYLRQRTDTLADQLFTIATYNASKSGTVTISFNPTNIDLLLPGEEIADGVTITSEYHQKLIFYGCVLFARRISDGAIQFVDLTKRALSEVA
jgi:hypothetical protein